MGVPFTQSSNLLAALDASLSNTHWPQRWQEIQKSDAMLCARLEKEGFQIMSASCRMPGIVTIMIPKEINSHTLIKSMAHHGYLIGGHSAYLLKRNWVQVCLMGQLQNDLLEILPEKLAQQLKSLQGSVALA